MLKSVTLENFFSFKERQTILLHPHANVLIGINGSGKSNFMKAIKLLAEGVNGQGVHELFSKWGGYNAVSTSTNPRANRIVLIFEIDVDLFHRSGSYRLPDFVSGLFYTFSLHAEGDNGYYIEEAFYSQTGPSEPKATHELTMDDGFFKFLWLQRGKGKASKLTDAGVRWSEYPARDETGEFFYPPKDTELAINGQIDPNDVEVYRPLFQLKATLSGIDSYAYLDTSDTSPMRRPNPFSIKTVLEANGSNLGSLLHRLSLNEREAYRRIEEELSEINPYFERLHMDPQGDGQMLLTLAEKDLNQVIPANNLSDGTLRFLCLLAIAFNPKNGKVVCLDEPEVGLHNDMVVRLARVFAESSQRQYFIATHSSFFLNPFEVENLLIFKKAKGNMTQVHKISEQDLDEWMDDYSLGQLWMMGHLGGVRY